MMYEDAIYIIIICYDRKYLLSLLYREKNTINLLINIIINNHLNDLKCLVYGWFMMYEDAIYY